MIALKLTNTKNFMNTLLRSDCFDHFLLQEATISAGATYVIDGHLQEGFYSEEEKEELGINESAFLPFALLRNQCFDLIKGKKTPSAFSFVFLLSPENLKKTLAALDIGFSETDVSAMFLNIRFQNGELLLTTGISYRTFQLDKALDQSWDRMVGKFLSQHQIDFDTV